MSWIRLSDSYIDHPKFLALSDGAFRLWHEALAFSRKHQTDGRLTGAALAGFRYGNTRRWLELADVGLWTADGNDYLIHDYHDWNPSRAEEQQRKDGTKSRMQKWRARDASPPPRSDASRDASRNTLVTTPSLPVTNASRDAFVLERRGESSSGSLEKGRSAAVADRAGALLEAYRAWFTELRAGARLLLTASPLDWAKACDLCALWDDPHLEKLARIFLTTDDEWIAHTGREFSVFALKASWCDGRLREWETKQKAVRA